MNDEQLTHVLRRLDSLETIILDMNTKFDKLLKVENYCTDKRYTAVHNFTNDGDDDDDDRNETEVKCCCYYLF